MKRWNIKNIVLYNKKEDRRIIEFNETGITIITGKSRTGKSVITEIIDYCLGSRECHFPLLIKETCSWVGLVLVKNSTQILILRKVPILGQKSSYDFDIKTSKNIQIPVNQSKISKTMNLDQAREKLESIFKIREIDNSFFNNKYKENKKISIRSLMPYLLQDDEIIISKNNILRGLNTEKRQSIVDSAPYFLGAVDENYVQLKSDLNKLKKELNIILRSIERKKEFEKERSDKQECLILEAKQVGLIKHDTVEEINSRDLLHKVLQFSEYAINNEEEEVLNNLYEQMWIIDNKIANMKNEIELTKSYLEDSYTFENVSNKQKSRFIDLGISNTIEHKSECPFCGNKTESPSCILNNIKNFATEIDEQIIGLEFERPKLDNYLIKLKEDLDNLRRDKVNLNNNIKALVKEKGAQKLLLEQRQNKVKGRIEYFLENFWQEDQYTSEELKKIELEEKIEEIQEKISIEIIKEKIEYIRVRINAYAFEIIKKLPLEDKYNNCPIDLNLNNMLAGVVTKYGKIPMRDIGSDLNYLCLHVAILLAIHRHFDDIDKEYCGFLIFDQLSRPFFPPDPKNNNELDEIVIAAENEKKELKQFFDYLFEEIEYNKSLQIIIFEHAYFAKDDKYVKSTKYRWNDEGLIPDYWI